MEITKDKKDITVKFDSLSEVASYLVNHHSRYSVLKQFNYNECSYSFQEAERMLKYGWPDGAARITEIANAYSGQLETTDDLAYNINYDVVGDYIDMGRFMTGEPECFGYIELVDAPKQSIIVKASASFAGHVKQDTIERRGAAILSLIEKLRRGNHVTLIIENRTMFDDFGCDYLTIQCHIDTHNEFSRDQLAFYLANSAFLRRIIWNIKETVFQVDKAGSYGNPRDNEEGNFYFRSLTSNGMPWDTNENAINEIERLLKRKE